MEQTKYTVFSEYSFQTNGAANWQEPSLQALIDRCAREFGDGDFQMICWAPEFPMFHEGGRKTVSVLRAESIAAGRTVEFKDGRYIPLGIPEQEKGEEFAFGTQAFWEYEGCRLKDGARPWYRDCEDDSLFFIQADTIGHRECDFSDRALMTSDIVKAGARYEKAEGYGTRVPINSGEQKAAAIGEALQKHLLDPLAQHVAKQIADPNAAMIARDGPAKPVPVAVAPVATPTAKPALPALTLLRNDGHQVDYLHGSASLLKKD